MIDRVDVDSTAAAVSSIVLCESVRLVPINRGCTAACYVDGMVRLDGAENAGFDF